MTEEHPPCGPNPFLDLAAPNFFPQNLYVPEPSSPRRSRRRFRSREKWPVLRNFPLCRAHTSAPSRSCRFMAIGLIPISRKNRFHHRAVAARKRHIRARTSALAS